MMAREAVGTSSRQDSASRCLLMRALRRPTHVPSFLPPELGPRRGGADVWRRGDANRNRIGELTALLVPISLAWILYGGIVPAGWFAGDDTLALRRTLELGPFALFFEPQAWRQFSTAFVMPPISLSFLLDHALFGLEPAGYFLHQLLSLSCTICLLFTWLRRYLTGAAACLSASVFAISTPVAAVGLELMTRHYVEGLLLALLSLLVIGRLADDKEEAGRRSWALAGLAAFFYLLSALCKEIFVPLPLLALFLPGMSRSKRWVLAKTLIGAAALYALWRIHLLGIHNALVSYGSIARERSLDSSVAWIRGIPGALGWNSWIIAALMVAAAGLALRKYRRWMHLGSCLALVALCLFAVAPLVGVIPGLAPRFFLMPALASSVLFGLALDQGLPRWHHRWMAFAVVLMVWVAISSEAGRDLVTERIAISQRNSGIGRFLLGPESEGVGVHTSIESSGFFSHLLWLRRHELSASGPAPRVCADACVCADASLRWVEITSTGRREIELPDGDCPPLGSIGGKISYDASRLRLRWRFGGAGNGHYFIARSVWDAPNSGHFVPVPESGEVPLFSSPTPSSSSSGIEIQKARSTLAMRSSLTPRRFTRVG
jgi:hypothetical protein